MPRHHDSQLFFVHLLHTFTAPIDDSFLSSLSLIICLLKDINNSVTTYNLLQCEGITIVLLLIVEA